MNEMRHTITGSVPFFHELLYEKVVMDACES